MNFNKSERFQILFSNSDFNSLVPNYNSFISTELSRIRTLSRNQSYKNKISKKKKWISWSSSTDFNTQGIRFVDVLLISNFSHGSITAGKNLFSTLSIWTQNTNTQVSPNYFTYRSPSPYIYIYFNP